LLTLSEARTAAIFMSSTLIRPSTSAIASMRWNAAPYDSENRANAFSLPRQAIFEKNGKKVVYRKRNGKFDPVEVSIATSTAGRVVVTKGVAKGDVIALVDPNLEEKDRTETSR